jgi:predicted nuclease of predicted toxin-antitoxin system
MNLLANESVDRPIVERLRRDGHDVVYVADLSPSITDDEVLQQANNGNALLVTADKDFGELVFRQGWLHRGVDCCALPACRMPPRLRSLQ